MNIVTEYSPIASIYFSPLYLWECDRDKSLKKECGRSEYPYYICTHVMTSWLIWTLYNAHQDGAIGSKYSPIFLRVNCENLRVHLVVYQICIDIKEGHGCRVKRSYVHPLLFCLYSYWKRLNRKFSSLTLFRHSSQNIGEDFELLRPSGRANFEYRCVT